MTNIGILENKISTVKKYLKILERYGEVDESVLKSDIDKKGALERYLYLLSQSTIDLAEATVSFKNLRKPVSYSDSFDALRESEYITDNLCTNLIRMTGFRNTLAHGYEKVDDSVLIEVLKNGSKDISKFLEVIEKLI